jgi:vacuolar-type H+-ATPase subunit E/Vma4
MVQEILKNISQKAEQELESIQSGKEKALLDLEKKYSRMEKEQKEKSLALFKQKAESEIKEFSQKKKLEVEFSVLKEKNKIIDELYKKAGEKITSEDLKRLVAAFLPQNIEGTIRAGRKTAKIIKEIKGVEAEDILGEEGFVILSQNADLDFRLSEVLKQSEQDIKPELIKILFS